jgi:hypothetical protein
VQSGFSFQTVVGRGEASVPPHDTHR